MWQHNYEPIAGSLGLSAIVAAVPIIVLFVMLGVLRKPAWMSASAALASALLVSLVVYRMPFGLAIISTIYGAAFGIFPIAWIVSLFDSKVAIYAVPNNGGWYDFGYFLGIVVFGVGARKSRVIYRDRSNIIEAKAKRVEDIG